MIANKNKVKRKIQLRHVNSKRQKPSLPKEVLEKAEKAEKEKGEPQLDADQLAILFICQRGHQSFISILQGVNSTRIPIGKSPLDEKSLKSLLKVLEEQGYLSKAEIHDQPTWTATIKAKELET